jgi:hypothetical protein
MKGERPWICMERTPSLHRQVPDLRACSSSGGPSRRAQADNSAPVGRLQLALVPFERAGERHDSDAVSLHTARVPDRFCLKASGCIGVES